MVGYASLVERGFFMSIFACMSTLPCQSIGINAPNTPVLAHYSPILLYFKLITRGGDYMQSLFPGFSKEMAFKSYCVLCYISASPKHSRTRIAAAIGFHKSTLSKIVPFLLKHRL